MSMEFIAHAASIEDDGYCTVVSFANEAEQPSDYLILQVVDEPSPQDIQLGQDGIHLQVGDQARGGYDFVRAINMKGECVEFILWKDAAERAGLDEQIVIHLQVQQEIIENIHSNLELMSSRIKPHKDGQSVTEG